MDVKISPPNSIKMVRIMSWELERTSISMADMLETVAADTEVKKRSNSLEPLVIGLTLGLVNTLKAKYPAKDRVMK